MQKLMKVSESRLNELRRKLDLAACALHPCEGGLETHAHYCRCDPEVGQAPCKYCALIEALRGFDELLRGAVAIRTLLGRIYESEADKEFLTDFDIAGYELHDG